MNDPLGMTMKKSYKHKPPKFPKTLAQFSIVKLRVLLRQPPAGRFGPDHKCVHRSLHVIILDTRCRGPVIKGKRLKKWPFPLIHYIRFFDPIGGRESVGSEDNLWWSWKLKLSVEQCIVSANYIPIPNSHWNHCPQFYVKHEGNNNKHFWTSAWF